MSAKKDTKKASDEISEAKIRQAIWMLKTKKTKKSVCEHLGIAYNTKRLDKIIEDFRAKEEREKELKAKAKNKQFSESEKDTIVNMYLDGQAQSAIAKIFYVSPSKIKNILIEKNVPLRARSKKAPAKTEHVVQDLDIKFKHGDRVFYAKENSFATIMEVYDEDYSEWVKQGRQRWVELCPWVEGKSKHPEPVLDVHYQIYWELDNGKQWKLSALKQHLKRVEDYIIDTGRETYFIQVEGDHSYQKMFVKRSDLFPVVYK